MASAPPETSPAAERPAFRNFSEPPRASVRELYRLNHTHQTLDFVRAQRAAFVPMRRAHMTVWEALERLDQLVDDSDPDTESSQLDHALQTAESLRRSGAPDWLVLTGLVHDLGKVLCLFGEPQWAVVGDTFPVGCAFDDRIVYAELFASNPDCTVPALATRNGIYEAGCGLDQVHLSWGHDEYLYHVLRDRLPDEALFVVRYHSFYAAHKEGAYDFLLSARDRKLLRLVRRFSGFDLYSKRDDRPDAAALRPRYEALVDQWLPGRLPW